ncbi:PDZ and LIM domain protein Zasp isoform X2 [Halyomorpha halys]|uniref:PDZ and LIM domain protein Zasp isoform X2 n=1 Tax=Halyomorpha halys TaxID=286706 RepID=UPI0034D1BC01
MAQVISVRLSRTDNSPWGIRLQGGKDFGQPLLIQKVNGGSLAERAGLLVGDAVIRVNNVDVSDMRHKEAQDTIVRAGNNFEVTVQRGSGSTWKPHVSPVGGVPTPGKASPMAPVTKTSLAATKAPSTPIGSGHNLSPKPFGAAPQVNGDAAVKAIVNKQYNTPVGMYSEEIIAETLSAQAEVLVGGAIGVNFMKNEKTYDSQKSEVFKMVQEVDKEPRTPEPETGSVALNSLRHVPPPEPRVPTAPSTQPTQLPPGQNICADCERLIVGVFVRIKDKNLHVECFKCATCGTSLKNVGYYNINNKLYCDIHAKMVARQNPPAPNLEPVTVPPGGRAPASAFQSQISSTPSFGSQSPQPGTLAPLPFHAPRTTTSHVTPRLGTQTQTFAPSGPKPFGSTVPSVPSSIFTPSSVAPPTSAPTNVAPPPAPPSSGITKPYSEPCTTVIWPPSSSHSEIGKSETSTTAFEGKRMSICSEEVCSFSSKKTNLSSIISEEDRCPSPVPMEGALNTMRKGTVEKTVIEAGERVLKTRRSVTPQPSAQHALRPSSPWAMSSRPKTPELLDISSKPHDIHSLLPPACLMRPMTPQQVVVFPPECPTVMYSRSPTPQRDIRKVPDRSTTCPSPLNTLMPYADTKPILKKIDKSTEKVEVSQSFKEHSKKEKTKKEHKSEKEHKIDKEHKTEKIEHKTEKIEHKTEKIEHKTEKQHKNEITAESKKIEIKLGNVTVGKEETSEETEVLEKMFYSKSEVEKLIQKEISKALLAKEQMMNQPPKVKEPEPVSVHDLPKPITQSGWMTNALTTASERPFSPVPFPKPLELPSVSTNIKPMEPMEIKKNEKPVSLPRETKPYFPPAPQPPEKEKLDDRVGRALREVGCPSPLTGALTVAPERPYSPIPTFTTVKQVSKTKETFKPIPGHKKEMSMASALTIAPSVPFTVPGKTPIPAVSINDVNTGSAFKPVTSKISSVSSSETKSVKSQKSGVCMALITEGGKVRETVMVSPVPRPMISSSIKPTPAYIPQPAKPKQEKIEKHEESSQSEKVEICQTKTSSIRPVTPSGLHPPSYLPSYQQNIGEIPVRNHAVSPVPHQIKAPEVNPTPMEYAHVSNPKMVAQYKATTFSETKTHSAQKSSVKSTHLQGTHKIDALKSHKEGLSPQSWKVEKYRQVQNLSPITVRLSSPRPQSPRPPMGETLQAADAKVFIHKPRPSSPLPPTVKVNVKYPPITTSGTTIGSEKSAFSKAGKNGETTTSSVHKKTNECCKKQSSESSCKTGCQKVDKPTPSVGQGEDVHLSSHRHEASDSRLNVQSGQEITQTSKQQEKHSSHSLAHKEQAVTNSQRMIHQDQGQQLVTRDQGLSSSQKMVSKEKGLSSSQQMIQTELGHSTNQQMMYKERGHSSSQQMAHVEQKLETQKEQRISSIQKKESQMEQHTVQAAQKSLTVSEMASSNKISDTADVKKEITPRGLTSFRAYGETNQKTFGHQSYETSVSDTINIKNNKKCISNKTNVVLPDNKSAIKPIASDLSPHPTFPSLPQLSDVDRTAGAGGVGGRTGTLAGSSAPKRGRGILNPSVAPGARIPLCGHCNMQIRGPFITALGKIWCPEHFVCVNAKCSRPLQDIGFVEEADGLYCEFCFEKFLAPTCDKCNSKIKGDCLNAIGKHFHPECFACAYCGKLFGNNPFFLEDSLPYCEADWNELFTTKCFSCGFPIEAGDRWVEALNNNYHSQCFNCTMCKKNLEGQSFYAKAGRPFCKNHAR